VRVLLLGTALATVDSGVRGSLEHSRLLKATPLRGATCSADYLDQRFYHRCADLHSRPLLAEK